MVWVVREEERRVNAKMSEWVGVHGCSEGALVGECRSRERPILSSTAYSVCILYMYM